MKTTKNKKPIKNSVLDIALLTCGLVDIPVFRDCVDAIIREAKSMDAVVHVMMNGLSKEAREPFYQIANTIPGVRLKHSTERLGFPVAANRIIRQGSSPFVFFITDDIILREGALAHLFDTMRDPRIGLCGMKLIFPEDSHDQTRPAGRVQHIGHAIDIQGEVTHPLMGWKPDNPKCCVTREVQSVTGGAFMARRNVFWRAGGFFEGYGVGYFEDVDLNLTIRTIPNGIEGNYQIWVNTDAVATHYTNMSMTRANVFIPMQTNRFIFQSRNGGRMINDSWTFW